MVKMFNDMDLNKVWGGDKVVNGEPVGDMDLMTWMGLIPLNGKAVPTTADPVPPATPAPAPVDPVAPIPEAAPVTPDPIVPDQPAPAPAAAPEDPVPQGGEANDEDVMATLDKILFETDDVAAAAEKLAEASGNKSPEEKEALLAQIQELTEAAKNWEKVATEATSQVSKAEAEKNLTAVEAAKMSKVYELVMDDEWLKSLIAYKKKSDEDPSYKDKLIDAARDFYEGVSWQSISDWVVRERKAEKTALGGGWSYASPANPDAGEQMLGGLLQPLK